MGLVNFAKSENVAVAIESVSINLEHKATSRCFALATDFANLALAMYSCTERLFQAKTEARLS